MANLDLTGYKLTFSDEFNTRSISATGDGTTWADMRSEWVMSDGKAEVGFGHSSFVDPSSGYDPFKVEGGALTITAAGDVTASGYPGSMESGLITTQGNFSQKYGYFEMRADLSNAPHAWDAFWMLPVQQVNPGTPNAWQELDVVEHYGENDKGVYSTIHTTDPQNGIPWQQNRQVYSELSNKDGYHTYGVLWEADKLSFYVDGELKGSQATPSDFVGPQYLIANLATQDGAVGGEQMKIDYIRAYSNDGSNPTVALGNVSSPDGHDPGMYGATALVVSASAPAAVDPAAHPAPVESAANPPSVPPVVAADDSAPVGSAAPAAPVETASNPASAPPVVAADDSAPVGSAAPAAPVETASNPASVPPVVAADDSAPVGSAAPANVVHDVPPAAPSGGDNLAGPGVVPAQAPKADDQHFANILNALEGGRWHSHTTAGADNNGSNGADLHLGQIGLSADVVAHAFIGEKFAHANLLADAMAAVDSFKGDLFKGDFNSEALAKTFMQTPQGLENKFSDLHAAQGGHFEGSFDKALPGNDSTAHADAEAASCGHQNQHFQHLWG